MIFQPGDGDVRVREGFNDLNDDLFDAFFACAARGRTRKGLDDVGDDFIDVFFACATRGAAFQRGWLATIVGGGGLHFCGGACTCPGRVSCTVAPLKDFSKLLRNFFGHAFRYLEGGAGRVVMSAVPYLQISMSFQGFGNILSSLGDRLSRRDESSLFRPAFFASEKTTLNCSDAALF